MRLWHVPEYTGTKAVKQIFLWQSCELEQDIADNQGVARTMRKMSSCLHSWFFTRGPHSSFDSNWPEYVHPGPQWLEPLPLWHWHSRDFPLVCDSAAVYSSEALWRSRLAVIIQLIGYERSRPVTPLLAPRTERIRSQKERLPPWILVTPAAGISPEKQWERLQFTSLWIAIHMIVKERRSLFFLTIYV